MDFLNSFKGERYEQFCDLSRHSSQYSEMSTRLRRFLSEYGRLTQSTNKKISSLCDSYMKECENLSYFDKYVVNNIKNMAQFSATAIDHESFWENFKNVEVNFKKSLKKDPLSKVSRMHTIQNKLKQKVNQISMASCHLATEKLQQTIADNINEAKNAKTHKNISTMIDKYNKNVDEIDSNHTENLKVLHEFTISYIKEMSTQLQTYSAIQMNICENNRMELEKMVEFVNKDPDFILDDFYQDFIKDEPLKRINKDELWPRVDKAVEERFEAYNAKYPKKGKSSKKSNEEENNENKISESDINSQDSNSAFSDIFQIRMLKIKPSNQNKVSSNSAIAESDSNQNKITLKNERPIFDSSSDDKIKSKVKSGFSQKKRKDSFAFSDDSDDDNQDENDNDDQSSVDSYKPIKITFKSKEKDLIDMDNNPIGTTKEEIDDELSRIASEIKLGFDKPGPKTLKIRRSTTTVIQSSAPAIHLKSPQSIDIAESNTTTVNSLDSIFGSATTNSSKTTSMASHSANTINMETSNQRNVLSNGTPTILPVKENTNLRKYVSTVRPSTPNMFGHLNVNKSTNVPPPPPFVPLSFAAIDTINFRIDQNSDPQFSVIGTIVLSINRNSYAHIKTLNKPNSIYFSVNFYELQKYITDFKINPQLIQSIENTLSSSDSKIKNYTVIDSNLLQTTYDMMLKESANRNFFIYNLIYYKITVTKQHIPINADFTMTLAPDNSKVYVAINIRIHPISQWTLNQSNNNNKNTPILSFVKITMALDELKPNQSNIVLIPENYTSKWSPASFNCDNNWITWNISEIPLSSTQPTMVELKSTLSSSTPILHNNSSSNNKLSISFSCENFQILPTSLELLPSTDSLYSLNVFKRKINTGCYIFQK